MRLILHILPEGGRQSGKGGEEPWQPWGRRREADTWLYVRLFAKCCSHQITSFLPQFSKKGIISMYRENKGRHISGSSPGGPQQREGELKCPGPFTSPSLTNPSEVHRDFPVCIYTSVFQNVYSVNSTVFFQLPLAIFSLCSLWTSWIPTPLGLLMSLCPMFSKC